jgi:DNA helicase-2/ATP-dependent DNA helicase PcrA
MNNQKFSVLDEIKLKLFIDRNFNRIGMRDLNMEIYKDTGYFSQLMSIVRDQSSRHQKRKFLKKISNALLSYEQTLIEASYFDFTMIMD